MVVLPEVDGVVEEDDEQICIDMDQFLCGEGYIDLLCGFHSLDVDGLFPLSIDFSIYLMGLGVAESSHVRLNIDIIQYRKGLGVS